MLDVELAKDFSADTHTRAFTNCRLRDSQLLNGITFALRARATALLCLDTVLFAKSGYLRTQENQFGMLGLVGSESVAEVLLEIGDHVVHLSR